jgi:hypothetical protein
MYQKCVGVVRDRRSGVVQEQTVSGIRSGDADRVCTTRVELALIVPVGTA